MLVELLPNRVQLQLVPGPVQLFQVRQLWQDMPQLHFILLFAALVALLPLNGVEGRVDRATPQASGRPNGGHRITAADNATPPWPEHEVPHVNPLKPYRSTAATVLNPPRCCALAGPAAPRGRRLGGRSLRLRARGILDRWPGAAAQVQLRRGHPSRGVGPVQRA